MKSTTMYHLNPTYTAHKLLVAATFLAALPCLYGQLPPTSAVMPPISVVDPSPFTVEAPAPGLDCFTYLLNLSDCLTFVTGGSNLTKPDPGCCPELASLVDTQPVCLCELLGNPGQTGISVDINRALKLPKICNVSTPPVSLCAAIGIPVGGALSPSSAPSPSEAQTPSPAAGSDGSMPPSSPSPANQLGDNLDEGPNNLASKQQFHMINVALVALSSLLVVIFF